MRHPKHRTRRYTVTSTIALCVLLYSAAWAQEEWSYKIDENTLFGQADEISHSTLIFLEKQLNEKSISYLFVVFVKNNPAGNRTIAVNMIDWEKDGSILLDWNGDEHNEADDISGLDIPESGLTSNPLIQPDRLFNSFAVGPYVYLCYQREWIERKSTHYSIEVVRFNEHGFDNNFRYTIYDGKKGGKPILYKYDKGLDSHSIPSAIGKITRGEYKGTIHEWYRIYIAYPSSQAKKLIFYSISISPSPNVKTETIRSEFSFPQYMSPYLYSTKINTLGFTLDKPIKLAKSDTLAITYAVTPNLTTKRGELYMMVIDDEGELIHDNWESPVHVDSDCDPDNYHIFTADTDGGDAEYARIISFVYLKRTEQNLMQPFVNAINFFAEFVSASTVNPYLNIGQSASDITGISANALDVRVDRQASWMNLFVTYTNGSNINACTVSINNQTGSRTIKKLWDIELDTVVSVEGSLTSTARAVFTVTDLMYIYYAHDKGASIIKIDSDKMIKWGPTPVTLLKTNNIKNLNMAMVISENQEEGIIFKYNHGNEVRGGWVTENGSYGGDIPPPAKLSAEFNQELIDPYGFVMSFEYDSRMKIDEFVFERSTDRVVWEEIGKVAHNKREFIHAFDGTNYSENIEYICRVRATRKISDSERVQSDPSMAYTYTIGPYLPPEVTATVFQNEQVNRNSLTSEVVVGITNYSETATTLYIDDITGGMPPLRKYTGEITNSYFDSEVSPGILIYSASVGGPLGRSESITVETYLPPAALSAATFEPENNQFLDPGNQKSGSLRCYMATAGMRSLRNTLVHSLENYRVFYLQRNNVGDIATALYFNISQNSALTITQNTPFHIISRATWIKAWLYTFLSLIIIRVLSLTLLSSRS